MSTRDAAETAVHQCMGLESDESCVIVTDDKRQPIGEALYEVASDVTDDTTIARYPPGTQHGEAHQPLTTKTSSTSVTPAAMVAA